MRVEIDFATQLMCRGSSWYRYTFGTYITQRRTYESWVRVVALTPRFVRRHP